MEIRAELVAATRRLVADGLCVGTAGNVSVRVDDGVLITPSGLDPARMTEADVVLVGHDGQVRDGSRAPSSELAMHLTVYRTTGARAVVHTHSPFAAALSTTLAELPAIHYLIVQLGGPVRVAGYALFGTEALARELDAALEGRSAILLQNHGAVTIGANLSEAYDRALLLEWLCSLYWHASLVGQPHLLTDAELDDVRAQVTRLHYGEQG
jgi:L-fuculose-phosphate aldolase